VTGLAQDVPTWSKWNYLSGSRQVRAAIISFCVCNFVHAEAEVEKTTQREDESISHLNH